MQNPYVALLQTAWSCARTEKRRYVLIYLLFTVANVLAALYPLLFDYVYILRNGQIADQGTFAELREHSAVFREMWHHQKEALSAGSLV